MLLSRVGRRCYSSAADVDKLLKLYPSAKNATPYQILGMKEENCMPDKLKRRFYELAKVYHPDSSVDVLTSEVRERRFKRILAAYTLLKNPQTRRNYDSYGIGWEDNSQSFYRPKTAPQSAPYHATEYGTWEDKWYSHRHGYGYGYHSDGDWKDMGPDASNMETFARNRRTILFTLMTMTGIYTALQFAHIIFYDDYIGGVYHESLMARIRMTEKSHHDLMDAKANYGYGDGKQERIERFLWFRQLTWLLGEDKRT
ncbi:hypothetical protein OGAPHI_002020 [Ogataea philodendri]|uniref:J domain-containing protein n=1 Tax=Ogataea philodendri TaxID=1378263 RepID=A0A9P8T6X4_9ASCO|nr:uncharacterized protein OGAPHI_002020 [Ogataea philodendri]KAH3668266.1 hypothetical protein OGAPHI_002020 [Ogataea philodendri]